MTIKENIFKVRERISSVCSRINRDPGSITIVCVSKGRTIEQIRQAIDAGITDIGENKVQEAAIKYLDQRLTTSGQRIIKRHMVGHLQTNKAREAVGIFDLIHSVDSLRLAREVDKQARKINKIQEILIEVNTSGEESKFGVAPEGAVELIRETGELKNINIKGLMTIAPVADKPEKAKPYFKMLRGLRDKINRLSTINYELSTLSMGMTDDFESAIEEGATMLRVGRAIFE